MYVILLNFQKHTWKYKLKIFYDKDDSKAQKNASKWKCVILVLTLFETEVIIATKIRREKNENCVEFSFHSISGFMSYVSSSMFIVQ